MKRKVTIVKRADFGRLLPGPINNYGSIDAPLTLLVHVAEADCLAVVLVRRNLRISVRTQT